MGQSWKITEGVLATSRHTTSYLRAGPTDGPLVILIHGWPELAISWRPQLNLLGGLGYHAVAPDMRGYGRSSVPADASAYALREIVADMIELIDGLGRSRAVWVGHDWGAPVAWSLAGHHPERTEAVAGFSVPYFTLERGIDELISLVDRDLYPEDVYPAGQWEYIRYYEDRLDAATAAFDADPEATVRALFRAGEPERLGEVAYTAKVRRQGGWFGGRGRAPDLPRDPRVLSDATLRKYAEALTRNGFHGPDSWYVNQDANAAYAAEVADPRLRMPALFLVGRYEPTCECGGDSRLPEPMRGLCDDLTEAVLPTGHWLAQEAPRLVNAALSGWLARRLEHTWPGPPPRAG
jgi:soluble epoxide hydrolase / lipid-phosphate phosphatase